MNHSSETTGPKKLWVAPMILERSSISKSQASKSLNTIEAIMVGNIAVGPAS